MRTKQTIHTLIILALALLVSTTGAAQNIVDSTGKVSDTLYLVTKTDGGEYYGTILNDDGREILMETKTLGKIYIQKSDIKSIAAFNSEEGSKYGEYRKKGPFTTRYYFTVNALPIKKKEHYALLHLYGPEVHFALSDQFSLGVMSTWIASPIGLVAKYSFKTNSDKVHLALGSIVGTSGYLAKGEGFGGLHFITSTYGTNSSNFSLSLGYGHRQITGTVLPEIGTSFSAEEDDGYDMDNEEVRAAIYDKVGRDYFYRSSFNSASVIGLSGITAIGEKSSLIFDSMVLLYNIDNVEYSDHDVTVAYVKQVYDPLLQIHYGASVEETFTIGKGRKFRSDQLSTTIILMPGMRFHRSYDKAFQVALAGIIQIRDGEVSTFPAPMISWFRKF